MTLLRGGWSRDASFPHGVSENVGCSVVAVAWLFAVPWLAGAAGAFGLPPLDTVGGWLRLALLIFGVLAWLFLAFLLLALLGDIWNKTRWAKRRSGRTWLGCTSRCHWRAFSETNLRPAVPDGVEFAWLHGGVGGEGSGELGAGAPVWLFRHESAPILFTVRSGLVHAERLHGELLPFKGRTQRDAALQQELRRRLEAALLRLEQRAAASGPQAD